MSSALRFWHVLLPFVLLAAGPVPARSAEPQADLPKASVFFDDQTMWLAFATSNKVMTLMEFIPTGQTLEDWTHLAAIHAYQDVRLGARKRAEALVAQIEKTHPEAPVDIHESPDSKTMVVTFALWAAGEPFVEFTIFAFETKADGPDVGMQYSIRSKAPPNIFLEQQYAPLRDRLVKLILRDGLHVSHEHDLNTIRLALSPEEQAICDTLLKDDAEGLKAVLEHPEMRSAVVLFVGSAIAFNSRQLEDCAFLLYAGQLRLRFDGRCFPPKKTAGLDPIRAIGGYSMELSSKITPAVGDQPTVFSRAIARVATWRPRAPSEYRPGYEFSRRLTEDEAHAGAEAERSEFLSRMHDLATLLNDERYFASYRLVKGLCVPGDDRLPTKEEYAAARQTMVRIAKEKGVAELRVDGR